MRSGRGGSKHIFIYIGYVHTLYGTGRGRHGGAVSGGGGRVRWRTGGSRTARARRRRRAGEFCGRRRPIRTKFWQKCVVIVIVIISSIDNNDDNHDETQRSVSVPRGMCVCGGLAPRRRSIRPPAAMERSPASASKHPRRAAPRIPEASSDSDHWQSHGSGASGSGHS